MGIGLAAKEVIHSVTTGPGPAWQVGCCDLRAEDLHDCCRFEDEPVGSVRRDQLDADRQAVGCVAERHGDGRAARSLLVDFLQQEPNPSPPPRRSLTSLLVSGPPSADGTPRQDSPAPGVDARAPAHQR